MPSSPPTRARNPDRPLRSVCVFCGSSVGNRPEYAHAARRLGRLLAERRIELVYGGGKVGLMGVLADAVLDGGGHVTGVIPDALARDEVAHDGVTELHVVESMHARKALMAMRSDAFIALPGGIGTFEELFEMLTWTQLRIHAKPCGLLDVGGYWNALVGLLDHAEAEGFFKAKHRASIVRARMPETLLARLGAWDPVSPPGGLTIEES